MRKHFVFPLPWNPSALLPGWLERNRFRVVTQRLWRGALPFPDAENMECSVMVVFITEPWDGLGGTPQIISFHDLNRLLSSGGHSSIPTRGKRDCQRSRLLLNTAGRALPFACSWEAQNGKNNHGQRVCPQAMETVGKYKTQDHFSLGKSERWNPCHQTVSPSLSLPWGIPLCVTHGVALVTSREDGCGSLWNTKHFPVKVLSCLCLERCNQNEGKRKIILFVFC